SGDRPGLCRFRGEALDSPRPRTPCLVVHRLTVWSQALMCIIYSGMEGLGRVLHGSATTTEAIRRAIQRSQASLRTLAKRRGINPKTVAKWRKRSSVADLPTGPKQPSSTVLSIEEAAIVALSRENLHRLGVESPAFAGSGRR